ncbi:S-adenosyl-L-methionine-dependent methyltransferase [Hyaloraphidium curvatum]|nr:S-adenosyl-L-methionine-dependent methyltransferase [Hyaloraphidium curvatum]
MQPRQLSALSFAAGFLFALLVLPAFPRLAAVACPAVAGPRNPALSLGRWHSGDGPGPPAEHDAGLNVAEEGMKSAGGARTDAAEPENASGGAGTADVGTSPAASPSACDLADEEGPDCNPLWKFALAHTKGRGLHKWLHYFDAYHRHFRRFRLQPRVVLLEIGVQSGGSIDMWRDYFGPDRLDYYGVDFNPESTQFSAPGVTIFTGDQANRTLWRRGILPRLPPPDIVIDDGGHRMVQQRVTLEETFPVLKEGGMYLCEDLHTSYWPAYGGGYRTRGTMVERLKGLVDSLSAWHSQDNSTFAPDAFTRSVRAMYFYDSMAFLYKRRTGPPEAPRFGTEWMDYGPAWAMTETGPEDPGEMARPMVLAGSGEGLG